MKTRMAMAALLAALMIVAAMVPMAAAKSRAVEIEVEGCG